MSSRPKTERDHLDLYLGWCLKNYASHAPLPSGSKRRLLRAASASSKFGASEDRSFRPFSLLRVFGRVLVMLLMVFEELWLQGPLLSQVELSRDDSRSHRGTFDVAMQSLAHTYPAGIGYSCLVG
ncbi:MAG: hypothetical protein GTO14_14445 [Anaerolineales bacterium]|nr:hypothetical protein [Anaerolineales bacterium]